MEIQGKVTEILPQQTGEGKNGQWRKNRFIIETQGQYPKKICIDVWGDKFDQMPITIGNDVIASLDIESREWKGNWYTDVKAWKVVAASSNQAQTSPPQNQPMDNSSIPPGKEPDISQDDFDDDLPF